MNNNKEIMIEKIFNSLRNEGEHLREKKELSDTDVAEQLNILIDTMRFLQNYDENVKILNQQLLKDENRFNVYHNEDEEQELA